MSGTTETTTNPIGTEMKTCLCCGCHTTAICMKGACVNCHQIGLCHE